MIIKFVFTILWLTSIAIAGSQERVEIIISDSSTAAFESFFGHASVFIVPAGKSWDEGMVYNFVAKVDGSSNMSYYRKGLTGGFPFVVESVPSVAFFENKIVHENRNIKRLLLPLTESQKQKLKATLSDLQKNPEKMGNYYFHIKNCVSMIFALLKDSGVQVKYYDLVITSLDSGIIPKHFEENARSSLLIPLPGDVIPSIKSLLTQLEEKYDLKIESVLDDKSKKFLGWKRTEQDALAGMSLEELILAAQGISIKDTVRSSFLQDLIRLHKRRVKVNFVRVKEFPDSFYTICEDKDKACEQRLARDIKQTYDLKLLKRLYRTDSMALGEAISYHPEFNFETSEQSQHWQRVVSVLKEILQD